MGRFLSYIRDSHSQLYKIGIIFFCITAIVYVLPKEIKFKYEISNLKGKPWHHENLIAPFDFAIKKSPEQLAKEREEIRKNSKPYFRMEEQVYKRATEKYAETFNEKWEDKSASRKEYYYNQGSALLDSVFTRGIILLTGEFENKPADFIVLLLRNNVEEERKLGSFFTIKTSYEFIKTKVENDPNKEFLLDIIGDLLSYNVKYDKETTNKFNQQALDNISTTFDKVQKDQSIVSKGEIVDSRKYQVLESLKMEYEGQSQSVTSRWIIIIGQFIIVSITLLILVFFLSLFRKDIYADNTKVTFLLFLIVFVVLASAFVTEFEKVSIYVFPFCLLPVITRAFYDTRVALFTHLVNILIVSFLSFNRFEFVIIQLIAGIVSIFSMANMRNRSQIFIAASFIFMAYSLSYFAMNIMQEGSFDTIDPINFAWFATSAVLTIFSYPLIFVFEKIFGFISDVSLMELSDMNSPLLRELSLKAPGTFQHSLQVANLAEDVIYQIGGNALLVRAGALYHDVGKIEMPVYFIENQTTGVNPHSELSSDESASIIISHVIRGVEMAKKYKVPEQIIDFIRTHHGTTTTWYFYYLQQTNFPGEKIDKGKFQYPGPIPFSKETAVLMMTDSVEAASRSLKDYNAETIGNLVDSIINKQIEQNQFVNSDITFRDINLIKRILKKKLMSIYHIRVEYPR